MKQEGKNVCYMYKAFGSSTNSNRLIFGYMKLQQRLKAATLKTSHVVRIQHFSYLWSL